ncbi:MAG: type II toxin-antitoxin system HicB family antitoxin [Treponema sp.]|jgi:predicted RNase H-like HicB family nuclease|nr:type II toxin-antitoxin system HicB family antitoxin [Treponema sp.]
MKTYIALFEYEAGKPGYGVVFPDLPGCISAGDDYADAFRMAHEALALYADSEDRLPEPRSLEEIKATWEAWPEWEQQYQFQVAQIRLYPLAEAVKLCSEKAFAIAVSRTFMS